MRSIATALFIALLLPPRLALSEVICGPQDYNSAQAPDFDCPGPEEDALLPDMDLPSSIPVLEGEVQHAPWSGALVHKDRLILYGLKLKSLRRLRWLDRLHIEEKYHIEFSYIRESSALIERTLEQQVEHYQDRAVAAEEAATKARAWYRRFGFGFACGAVGALALVILSVYVGTLF